MLLLDLKQHTVLCWVWHSLVASQLVIMLLMLLIMLLLIKLLLIMLTQSSHVVSHCAKYIL